MSRRGAIFGVVCALAISGASTSTVAASEPSLAKAAFHVRALQTELMVAALSCKARAHYNDFAVKFQDVLVRHGRALKSRFHRAHGKKSGEKKLNAYVTALANKTSQKSVSEGDAYCARAMGTFAQLSVMPTEKFTSFAQNLPYGDAVVPKTFQTEIRVVNRNQ